ncbi:hypothetical protein N1I86_05440 [Bacillus sp. FSL W8-0116]|uniref:hypothetical protein n=1 Tax=Bacillus sp. FSL W8-0116 TaxID=2978206 RepID=UPI0030F61D30
MDAFEHLRKWQNMMNNINSSQRMINQMTRTSELASKLIVSYPMGQERTVIKASSLVSEMRNSGLIASYHAENVNAIGKVSTLAREMAKSSAMARYSTEQQRALIKASRLVSELAKTKSGLIAYFSNNSVRLMANIPRHDFSKIAKAITLLNTHKVGFSNTHKFSSFFNHLSSNINDSFVEKLNEYVQDKKEDEFEEIEGLQENLQVDIKQPEFFNLALKTNIILDLTDADVQEGKLDEEDVSAWKKVLTPILTVLGQLFLAWAFSDTPIQETNIYKSIESIIQYVEKMNIDIGDQEQQQKLPEKESQ